MRKVLILIFAFSSLQTWAQLGPGWHSIEPLTKAELEKGVKSVPRVMALRTATGDAKDADEATPEIEALARGLLHDPIRIYDYVLNHIKYRHYYGCKKGATVTYLDGSGNDFDQCTLLVALLKECGLSPQYQYGYVIVPYDNHPDKKDIRHWIGGMDNSGKFEYYNIVYLGGIPQSELSEYSESVNEIKMPHVWVKVDIGGTTHLLDPSFETMDLIPPIDLTAASGANASDLLTTAGGTSTTEYVEGLDYASISNKLSEWSSNLLNHVRANYPNSSPIDVMGGRQRTEKTISSLPTSLGLELDTETTPYTWDEIPEAYASKIEIKIGNNAADSFYLSELHGKRLSLDFHPTSHQARLRLEDTIIRTESGGTGSEVTIKTTVHSPFQSPLPTHSDNGITYQRGGHYAILYAYDTGDERIRQRQQKLQEYKDAGYANDDRRIRGETLNIIGLYWAQQVFKTRNIVSHINDVFYINHHLVGRISQEDSYYIDIALGLNANILYENNTAAETVRINQSGMMFASALEHAVIEQMQDPTNKATSTTKLMYLGNENGKKTFRANLANWTTGSNIKSQLKNYEPGIVTNIQEDINGGQTCLLPEYGNIVLNQWKGVGYMAANNTRTGMIIGGNLLNGGYSSFPGFVAPRPVTRYHYSAPRSVFRTPVSAPVIRRGDPVDIATGGFLIDEMDISLGRNEPQGFAFSRSYNSQRRLDNPAGLGYGWTHNYHIKAEERSGFDDILGGASSYEILSYLVSMYAASQTHDLADPKKSLTAFLATKWGVDQLIRKNVSITKGSQTIQFLQMPDGRYIPPAGVKVELIKNASGNYEMTFRHGNTYRFDGEKRIDEIEDLWGRKLAFEYNTDDQVKTVTDHYNRTLTFTYANKLLDKVTDNTGRVVDYGYASKNLTSVKDPENNTVAYSYLSGHRLEKVYDAYSKIVTHNFYDDFGRVTEQNSMGDTNRNWKFYYSGRRNIVEDPAEGRVETRFDQRGREIITTDANGNTTEKEYDGQNHQLLTRLPNGGEYITQYDVHHNPTNQIDPLGHSATTQFDDQHRPQYVGDYRKNVTTNTYNDQHQPLTITTPEGETTTYTYYPNGKLNTITDADNFVITGYYDTLERLKKKEYHDGTYEEFFYTNHDDLERHLDIKRYETSYTYDNNRKLLNTTFPDNSLVKKTYDKNKNLQTTTDAQSNTTTYIYNQIADLTEVTYADTTKAYFGYDIRDWPVSTTNHLGHTSFRSYDPGKRVISRTDPLLRSIYTGYDLNNNPIVSTNKRSYATHRAYNARNELITITNAQNNTIKYAFDPNGNRLFLTNRNNKVYSFTFDKNDRLKTLTTPTLKTTTRVYNDRGLLESVEEPSGQTTTFSEYDHRGRLKTSIDPEGTITRNYDNNGNLTHVTEGADTISRGHDEMNRLTAYTNASGDVIRYEHDNNGNLTKLVYPGNKAVDYVYDNMKRLDYLTDWANRTTDFEYDEIGRLRYIRRPNGTFREMRYNDAGELTYISERNSSNRVIHLQKITQRDGNGNLEKQLTVPIPQAHTFPGINATYDDDNRLATFNGLTITHDPDGNMTSGPLLNDSLQTYTFDARNRLKNVGGVSYTYDAENNLIGENSTEYTVNLSQTLSQVLIRKKDGKTTYYIYGLGLLYEETDDVITTYHYDHQGNTVALTDENQGVADRAEYAPYGLTTHRTGTHDTPFWYNGRYGVITSANGLLSMRNRFYNPYLRRFINQDPLGFAGGLNWYAYADGNPLNAHDPFGLKARSSSWGSGFADIGQGIISAVGLFPLLGNFADGANAAISTYRGDYFGATLDGVSAIPTGGWATGAALTGTRIVSGATKIVTPVVNAVRRAWSSVTTFAKGLSSSIVSGVKKAFKRTPQSQPLYRAVGPDELADISNTGAFRNPPGIENKYFSTTEQGAKQYGEMAEKAFGDPPYTTVKTSIPDNKITPGMSTTVDGGIPTVTIPTDQLPNLAPPVVNP